MKSHSKFWISVSSIAIAATIVTSAHAQIGGQTAADGPFILDDAEAGDLVAVGVERNWISDFNGLERALDPIDPVAEGLTLASGQTPEGALQFYAVAFFGFIDMGFGVPMPAEKGISTDPNANPPGEPGDITSFTHLTFLACHDPVPGGAEFWVVLESYPQNPDESFPRLIWEYVPIAGTTFQPVTIDLRAPSAIENGGGHTVEDLLSQTRFLAFQVFAGPVAEGADTTLYIDDITLQSMTTNTSNAWMLLE